jgi:hypothetical protein
MGRRRRSHCKRGERRAYHPRWHLARHL